jgi:hypothetical protein
VESSTGRGISESTPLEDPQPEIIWYCVIDKIIDISLPIERLEAFKEGDNEDTDEGEDDEEEEYISVRMLPFVF